MASKKKATFKSRLINVLLVLLLFIGIALIFNNQIKDFLIHKNGSDYSVSNLTKDEIKKNSEAETSFDFAAVEPASTEAVIKAQFSNKRLPAIGGVAVPSVGINLPIFKGVSNEVLLWGAGTMSETQVMGEGNYGLASHRATNRELLFTPLERVEEGALVYLTDLTHIYTYKIVLKVRVQPTEVQYLDEVAGKKLVTLVTCGEMGGKTRIVVQGELQSVTDEAKATDAMLKAFEMEQKAIY